MATSEVRPGLSWSARASKRIFDIVFSLIGLILCWWLILLSASMAAISTRESGFFRQKRVGQNGKLFEIVKIRTMRTSSQLTSTVTTADDPRITSTGRLLRRTKLDELPQLWNVLKGDMSFVGPRPDVPGFADSLTGEDRIILSVRPGITGPATLAFRNEEQLLQDYSESDRDKYNREVLWQEKVRLNREYVERYAFSKDLRLIWETLFPSEPRTSDPRRDS